MAKLRPCLVGIYQWSTELRRNELVASKPALFHEWGLDVIESESGNASYSVAIVEFADGCVEVHPPYAIQLTGRKAEVKQHCSMCGGSGEPNTGCCPKCKKGGTQ